MSRFLKVAEPDELPPGRGKTIAAAGRELTIVNREGRYLAIGRGRGHEPIDCVAGGRTFALGIGEVDRVELVGDRTYHVRVDERGVWVLVDEIG